jgi:hypothetical protein
LQVLFGSLTLMTGPLYRLASPRRRRQGESPLPSFGDSIAYIAVHLDIRRHYRIWPSGLAVEVEPSRRSRRGGGMPGASLGPRSLMLYAPESADGTLMRPYSPGSSRLDAKIPCFYRENVVSKPSAGGQEIHCAGRRSLPKSSTTTNTYTTRSRRQILSRTERHRCE